MSTTKSAFTAAHRAIFKQLTSNFRRNSVLLALSATSTLSLLGVTVLSGYYLPRANQEFATKICLFLAGVSTAVTIHAIGKEINGLVPHIDIPEEGYFSTSRQIHQINIENFSGNLKNLIEEGSLIKSNQTHQINIENFSGNLENLIDDVVINSSSDIDCLLTDASESAKLSDSSLSEVIVMEPSFFEEMTEAVRIIQEGKSIVLNLTLLSKEDAQRAVDFVAGGTYGMKGHQERIGESIFLFTPRAVQASTLRTPQQDASRLTSGLSLTSTQTPMLSRSPGLDKSEDALQSKAYEDAG